MLTWMLVGTAILFVLAWKVVHNAQSEDRLKKLVRKPRTPERYGT
jgi:hypothetical protein